MDTLCLHGYLQTGTQFRGRLGSLRKLLKRSTTFSFKDAYWSLSVDNVHTDGTVEAKHDSEETLHAKVNPSAIKIYPSEETVLKQQKQSDDAAPARPPSPHYGWYVRDHDTRRVMGLEQSLREVEEDVRRREKEDRDTPLTLLGFSQGATVLSLLLHTWAVTDTTPSNLRGAVLVSPWFPVSETDACAAGEAFSRAWRERVDSPVPLLVVHGEGDTLVPRVGVDQLTGAFGCETPILGGIVTKIVHSGGHYVAAGKGLKEQWREWFQNIE